MVRLQSTYGVAIQACGQSRDCENVRGSQPARVHYRLQRKLTTLLSDGQSGSSTLRPFFGPRGLSAARSVDRGHIACIVVGVSAKCK